MARRTSNPGRIVDAALRLAAERGWRDLTLPEIAAAAECSLADLYGHFPSKGAILDAYSRRIDLEVLKTPDEPETAESTARDRLFDVMMRRLDALAPHKEGLRAILADLPADPLAAARQGRHLVRSMSWMLEAAGIRADGLAGMVRVRGLAAIYLATLRTWMTDEGEDMGRTMARLDQLLRRAEPWAASLSRCRRADR